MALNSTGYDFTGIQKMPSAYLMTGKMTKSKSTKGADIITYKP